ncbi:MAG: signal recognition particle protein [candidate division Zixibacteria bacterium]|nr:signal recognition particle protein [candidate division Zixibacteria bacterium]
MFDSLTEKLEATFKKLRGLGTLTEDNIKEALKEIRRALLEADVNYKVTKDFIQDVQAEAVGAETIRSVEPGQLIVKIVHEKMIKLLGEKTAEIQISERPPSIIMICGLQGSGKTTLTAKLGLLYKKKKQKVLLVAADPYRPAAVKQLQTLGKQIDVEVFEMGQSDPVTICKGAISKARKEFVDLIIFDTAGRLHIDEELMNELSDIKKMANPREILLVADAMTGQDAVNVAREFHEKLNVTGVVLSKMDGDARGGAALSIRGVTGCPLKLVGIGEKLTDLEPFHPDRMASRILGMGDIVSFVEKAQEMVDFKEAEKLEKKLRKSQFTLEDFLNQLQQLKKMGPLESIMEMIPGMGKALKGATIDPKAMKRVEAMVLSMTPYERQNPKIINGSRRKRIAAGSGTTIQDLNRMLKQFAQMKKMIKSMGKMNFKGLPKDMMPF